MQTRPFISVIIPTYDSSRTIDAAIGSVLNQTYSDFELIIVDDGSQDDTRACVMGIDDVRIRYFWYENAGRAAARNTGIEQAKGDWVAFLDADDLWLPEKLEKQIAAVQTYPQAVMVYSQYYIFSHRDAHRGWQQDFKENKVIGFGRPGASNCLNDFLLANFDVRTSTVMVEKETFNNAGGFDSQFKIVEDWDLFMRVAYRGQIIYLDEPLAAYRLGPYKTRLDRARKYNWHHEMLRAAEKNVESMVITENEPEFAKKVLAAWEWRCSLFEFGLGNIENSKNHCKKALEYFNNILEEDLTAIDLGNYLIDVQGKNSETKTLYKDLKFLLSIILPSTVDQHSLYHKTKGYLYAVQAFDSYATDEIYRGLLHAFSAVRDDRNWLRNRGLWSIPIRKTFRKFLPQEKDTEIESA